jgi:hypothetical protein
MQGLFYHGPSLKDKQRDEAGDIAGEVAYDTVTEHEKVKELESRIDELQRKLN